MECEPSTEAALQSGRSGWFPGGGHTPTLPRSRQQSRASGGRNASESPYNIISNGQVSLYMNIGAGPASQTQTPIAAHRAGSAHSTPHTLSRASPGQWGDGGPGGVTGSPWQAKLQAGVSRHQRPKTARELGSTKREEGRGAAAGNSIRGTMRPQSARERVTGKGDVSFDVPASPPRSPRPSPMQRSPCRSPPTSAERKELAASRNSKARSPRVSNIDGDCLVEDLQATRSPSPSQGGGGDTPLHRRLGPYGRALHKSTGKNAPSVCNDGPPQTGNMSFGFEPKSDEAYQRQADSSLNLSWSGYEERSKRAKVASIVTGLRPVSLSMAGLILDKDENVETPLQVRRWTPRGVLSGMGEKTLKTPRTIKEGGKLLVLTGTRTSAKVCTSALPVDTKVPEWRRRGDEEWSPSWRRRRESAEGEDESEEESEEGDGGSRSRSRKSRVSLADDEERERREVVVDLKSASLEAESEEGNTEQELRRKQEMEDALGVSSMRQATLLAATKQAEVSERDNAILPNPLLSRRL